MISTHRGEICLRKIDISARYIAPSAVSCFRVALAVVLLANFQDFGSPLLVGALVAVVFGLDAVDGILARNLKSQSLPGSFVDIFCDRAVELIFLQHFVSNGLVPLWFVLVFYGRIALTDGCRMRAFKMKRVSATGIYLPRPWRFLVLSKLSRSLYGAVKAVFFGLLLLAMRGGATSLSPLEVGMMIVVLSFSLLRAGPILFSYFPKLSDSAGVQVDLPSQVPDIATRTTRIASGVQLALDVTVVLAILMKLAYGSW